MPAAAVVGTDPDDLVARELASRCLRLHDGRTLELRAMRPEDAPQLAALFDGLSIDDRHRRFFSAFHPDVGYLEHYADIASRGGFGIVAVVSDATGDEFVGEATYSVEASVDGELGITVAEAWRGWLGHYLLDALVAVAALRGIPHLYADVLHDNSEMHALLRARDGVVIDHPELALTRFALAAAQPVTDAPVATTP